MRTGYDAAVQNVEFKAELRDVDAARTQCEVIEATRIGYLHQTDTYFRMPDGRLKKREARSSDDRDSAQAPEPTEWIYYHRHDDVSPRLSNYTILTDLQARRRWGVYSLRPWIAVKKVRELWMLENVRIHLDEVEQLGTFVEFEAIISPEHTERQCRQYVAELREEFAPILGEPIAVSYVDLLALEMDLSAEGAEGAETG